MNLDTWLARLHDRTPHYNDVIMGAIAPQITSPTIVYSSVYSGADQKKHQSSASVAFVWGIHRWPVDSPHKWPVTWKMFPFDDVIMCVADPTMTTKWHAPHDRVHTLRVSKLSFLARWILMHYLSWTCCWYDLDFYNAFTVEMTHIMCRLCYIKNMT